MTPTKVLATILVGGVVATSVTVTVASQAWAFTGEEYSAQANVGLKEARAIALKVFSGNITSEELEIENGGSGLRYSFDIKNGSVVHEVGVDAKTGHILENSVERAGGH
jgi:uncharacterized membrane protein YkoI